MTTTNPNTKRDFSCSIDRFYAIYSAFVKAFYCELKQSQPQMKESILFRKSYKLVNRFIFILCAEAKNLLPTASVSKILRQNANRGNVTHRSIYDTYKIYFAYLYEGRPAQNGKAEIFAYRGGLFAYDADLENFVIKDNILLQYLRDLAAFDYENEINIRFLQNVFTRCLQKNDADFMFPAKTSEKVSTCRYFVENSAQLITDGTVGEFCEAYKTKYKIVEIKYHPNCTDIVKKGLLTKLRNYRKRLLSLKICDLCCDSGDVLCQILDYLTAEHLLIDELQIRLTGEADTSPNNRTDILANNIYGADCRAEATEFTCLLLWLKTVERRKALTDLNYNIIHGDFTNISPSDDSNTSALKGVFPAVFPLKDKQGYHVVLTTHNSRTSRRMIKYKVRKGPPVEMDLDKEIILTEIMGDLFRDNGWYCLAYNVCKDHVHLVVVCTPEELVPMIQKLKSISSKLFNRRTGRSMGHDRTTDSMGHDRTTDSMGHDRTTDSMGHDPLKVVHLWSQKFFRANLDVWKLNNAPSYSGMSRNSTYLSNAINYVRRNRIKHRLPFSAKLQTLIADFVVDLETAFTLEQGGGFDIVIDWKKKEELTNKISVL